MLEIIISLFLSLRVHESLINSVNSIKLKEITSYYKDDKD